jgi:DNA-binding CsgD family transcriptional regulator
MVRVVLDSRDKARVREIATELAIVRLDEPRSVCELLPAIRDLVEIDTVGLYSVQNRTGRWMVDWCEGFGELDEVPSLLRRMFTRTDAFPLMYNPTAAPAGQRNRVVDAYEWIQKSYPAWWDESPMCRDVLRRVGAEHHHQPRVLICDGSAVVAWFGGLQALAPTPRQMHVLGLFVEPMRRRLLAEHRLRESAYATAALDVALERIGAAAFVIGERGGVRHANRAGRALLERSGAEVIAALRDAVAGRQSSIPVELLPIEDGDYARSWLGIVSCDSATDRVAAAVEACRTRWGLTPKQAEVLGHLAAGLSNAAIAGLLGCVERTIELHVTALFDKIGVDSRSALVARVLTIR